MRVFGYERGSLGPIGLRRQPQIQVVVDAPLLATDAILCGGGDRDVVYAIDPHVLEAAVGAVVAAITQKDE